MQLLLMCRTKGETIILMPFHVALHCGGSQTTPAWKRRIGFPILYGIMRKVRPKRNLKQEVYDQASLEAAARQQQGRLKKWRKVPLALATREALGKVSPELAWLQVEDLVYEVTENYCNETKELADEMNWEMQMHMDLEDLRGLLAEMNPVLGINEFHWINPEFSLRDIPVKDIPKEKALAALLGVLRIFLLSDHWLAPNCCG
jgi:hypothetical protein